MLFCGEDIPCKIIASEVTCLLHKPHSQQYGVVFAHKIHLPISNTLHKTATEASTPQNTQSGSARAATHSNDAHHLFVLTPRTFGVPHRQCRGKGMILVYCFKTRKTLLPLLYPLYKPGTIEPKHSWQMQYGRNNSTLIDGHACNTFTTELTVQTESSGKSAAVSAVRQFEMQLFLTTLERGALFLAGSRQLADFSRNTNFWRNYRVSCLN